MATVKSKSSILLGLVAFTSERRVSPSVVVETTEVYFFEHFISHNMKNGQTTDPRRVITVKLFAISTRHSNCITRGGKNVRLDARREERIVN